MVVVRGQSGSEPDLEWVSAEESHGGVDPTSLTPTRPALDFASPDRFDFVSSDGDEGVRARSQGKNGIRRNVVGSKTKEIFLYYVFFFFQSCTFKCVRCRWQLMEYQCG